MPAVINSNQIYRAGECPIFVAFITKTDGTPLTYGDITSISVTHMQRRDGIRNGIIVTDWFPVASSDGLFENVDIDRTNVLGEPVDIDETDVDIYAKNFSPTLRNINQYNFLYIPFDGHRYYPNNGSYCTVFRITLVNGKTDVLTFYSTASDTLEVQSSSVEFGKNIDFTGVLYAKYREPLRLPDDEPNLDHGKVIFPNAKFGNVIDDVLLTVFDVATAQRLIDRERLGNEIITITDITDKPNEIYPAYELNYIFPTTKLPVAGLYRFRFEAEARREILGTDVYSVLCVFDIDVSVI